MTFAVDYLYFGGSFLFIVGSIPLYWTTIAASYVSTVVFIVASMLYLIGAVLDIMIGLSLPNLLYLVGGFAFVIGSFLFLPTFETMIIGFWIFRIGSCSYFFGSLYLAINRRKSLRTVVALVL